MRNQLATISVAAILVLSGCATPEMSPRTRDTAIGAGVGASAGALIGAIAGGGKGAAIGGAAGAGLGAIAGNVWSRKMEEQKKEMEQATAGTGVQVVRTSDNRLKLDIPSDISFDTGRAEIKSDFKPVLDSFATSLTNNPGTRVSIIGHTDSSGSDAINNPLSLNRAASTRDYLVSRGVSASRINIDGRGSRQPLVANDTLANRAKNRRVEIFVAEPQAAPQ
ncbi:OmpA family protein [Nitrosovibrio tenuis]|uniref:Outer membrane protein OmpA n=1 Tax=Nitrosovibrio tenuis TaxID=1233 RepID=A0A1H7H820_9PROT|nr:OmpA family protein [Nitrosovibrio tenuis]SEK46378.1 Outer membrane protein OmpA [Nitrosovibrio tenuis]